MYWVIAEISARRMKLSGRTRPSLPPSLFKRVARSKGQLAIQLASHSASQPSTGKKKQGLRNKELGGKSLVGTGVIYPLADFEHSRTRQRRRFCSVTEHLVTMRSSKLFSKVDRKEGREGNAILPCSSLSHPLGGNQNNKKNSSAPSPFLYPLSHPCIRITDMNEKQQ